MSDTVTERIIGAAIEVHRVLGPGLLEQIYEDALCHEFDLREIAYRRQVEIEIDYKGLKLPGQRLDLLVENDVVVELKSISRLPEVAMAQLLSYLRAANLKRGLLINFGQLKLIEGIKRVSL